MIFAVGTDILLIKRMPPYDKASSSFFAKTFSPAELLLAQEAPLPELFFAGRFAAKEAVFKALRCDNELMSFREIEILRSEEGAPVVRLCGEAARAAAAHGIKSVSVSISSDTDYALAFAVSEC